MPNTSTCTPTVPSYSLGKRSRLRITSPLQATTLMLGIGLAALGAATLLMRWIAPSDGSFAWLMVACLYVFFAGPLTYGLLHWEYRRVSRMNTLACAVTQGSTDAIFVKDLEGKYLLFNEAAAQFVGVPIEDVLGKDDTALFDPESARHIMARDRRIMLSGVAETEEEELTSSGVTRTYLAMKAPYFDDQGNVIGLVGISRDITEGKQAQRILHQRELFVRGVLDSMSACIAVLDAAGFITAVNEAWQTQAAEELTVPGLAPQGGIGSNFFELCENASHYEPKASAAAAGIRQVIEGLQLRFVIDYSILTPNGERWFQMSVTRLDHDAGSAVIAHTNITEQKCVEKRLQESERAAQQSLTQLETVVKSLSDGIVIADNHGNLLDWNPAALRMHGFQAGDDVRKHASNFVENFTLSIPGGAPLDYADWPITRLLRGETVEDFELEVRRHDIDRKRVIRYSGSLVIDNDGQPELVVLTLHDVTERRRMEDDLRASEQRFREFVNHAADAFFLHDVGGKVVDVNRQACAMLGYSRAELIGKSPIDFDPEITPDRLNGIWSGLHAGETVTFESRHRRKDGTTFPVEIRIRPFESFGRTFAVALAQDITARKKAERVLQERERLLRVVTQSAKVGLAVVNRHYEYLFSNDAYAEIIGVAADEIPGRTQSELLTSVWLQVKPHLDQALDGQQVTYELTLPPEPGRPHVRWLKIMYEPRTDEMGQVTVVIVVVDLTEQKRAEIAIHESEQRFRKIFEHAATGIAITDATGNFRTCNPAYCSILGYSKEELVQLAFPSLIHPDDRENNLEQVRRLQNNEIAYFETENRYIHKNGEAVWVNKFVSMIPDEAGGPPVLLGLVTDITERRRAELALRESEERYRLLVDMLPGAVFVHARGTVVFCNPAFVRLMGASSAQDLLGMNAAEMVHPEYHSLFRARTKLMHETNRSAPGVEMRFVRLDGRSIPVYTVATPIAHNQDAAILSALSDLTERERSMELLRSVLASVDDVIITINSEGTVLSANPATEKEFGYSPAELIGHNVKQLMPEPFRSEHDDYLSNYLRTGQARVIGIGREAEGLRRDGSRFPAELTVTEFQLDGERCFTGVIRNITARNRLEAQFQQAQKMEAVGRLAGGVAHDFNNLLTIINGYSDLLLSQLPVENTSRESIALIRDAGDRAARLTQQLLAFSRKAVIEPKVLDLNVLVSDSSKMLRRLIGEDLMLAVVLDPKLPRIKADPGQIEQILLNLVVNARDAMPNGGRLTIETRAMRGSPGDSLGYPDLSAGDYAQLSVSDTGLGMDEEVKSRIFEPFYTTKGVGKGTGLGLSVVHGVITQCGGRVDVETAPGQGTTFSLLFPAVNESALEHEHEGARCDANGNETVLLVEDDINVRTVAKIALESKGYTVLEASCGADAVQIAEDAPASFDILVTDVVMPAMGGRQLAEQLRTRLPNMRVLFISGYTGEAVFKYGPSEPTDGFLQKPFTPQALARMVRSVLDGPTDVARVSNGVAGRNVH